MTPANGTPLVEAVGLTRTFPMGAGPVHALRDVSLRIDAGDYLAIRGPSGCGKSTLLHILGCVDTPTGGTLLFDGRERRRSAGRRTQRAAPAEHRLRVPAILPAADADGRRKTSRCRRRRPASDGGSAADGRAELLEYVGLAHRANHRPSQLSGGEAQRVAIARALANRPRLLLADEPTGELDRATGEQIAALLDRVQSDGTAVVVVTHDAAIAARAARTLIMADGRLARRQWNLKCEVRSLEVTQSEMNLKSEI